MITEGARRVEQRWDPTENGQVVPDDKSVGRKLADDAMYKLEHGSKDKDKSTDAAPRLGKLAQIQDRVKDDYLANRLALGSICCSALTNLFLLKATARPVPRQAAGKEGAIGG